MKRDQMKNYFYGLLCLAVGTGYLLDFLGIIQFTIFFRGWWGILIAIFAVANMIDDRISFGNIFFFLVGIYLYFDANGFLQFHITFGLVVAIVCFYIGIKLLFDQR